MKTKLALAALLVAAVACGKDSPTGPSTTDKIIRLMGNLDYGEVRIGDSVTRMINIANDGGGPLSFTGLQSTCASQLAASPTSGTVQPRASVDVTLRFTPTTTTACSGTVTILADHTSGTNTLPITARGSLNGVPIYTVSGKGNTVFDMPTYITRVRIQGVWDRTQTSNFIVRIGGQTVVNEILRDSITYDGIHLTTGGVVSITSSAQISWTFTEIR